MSAATGQSTYAPLPFSYLTGGGAADRRPTGLKKAVSQDDGLDRAGHDPYSIYSGRQAAVEDSRNLPPARRKNSIDVIDPKLDVTDPYLLSTGAIGRNSSSLQDVRNSYSDDPRYRDSVPSENDGGNVFFRSPDGSESSGKSPRSADNLIRTADPAGMSSLARPGHNNIGHTNPDLATMTRDEDAQGKKLPRFKVANDDGYQYYSGANGVKNTKPISQPATDQPKQGMDNASNPIWDKYYAAGGLAPGYESQAPPTSPVSPGVRPTTKYDDFNTLIRTSGSSDAVPGRACLHRKRGAVLCAVIITAIICLGAGFAAGWFIFQVVNSTDATTTAIPATMAQTSASTAAITETTTSTTTSISTTTATTSTPSASTASTLVT